MGIIGVDYDWCTFVLILQLPLISARLNPIHSETGVPHSERIDRGLHELDRCERSYP